jgi:hypothetical protein
VAEASRGSKRGVALSSSTTLCHLEPIIGRMSENVQQKPEIKDLWNESPTSLVLARWLLGPSEINVVPEVKEYPDAVYYNYFQLGISILFQPAAGYKPGDDSQPDTSKLSLQSIDVYNDSEVKYATYPSYPLVFAPSPVKTISITPQTSGKDFVQALGEPERKGGGNGPMSGSIGIWCEWSKLGLMVELGGDDVRGPQAWEKGKDAKWKTITLFSPTPP